MGARDEQLAEVREPRVADGCEGALGGQEADVADELALALGDVVPDVVVPEQPRQPLELLRGRRLHPADGRERAISSEPLGGHRHHRLDVVGRGRPQGVLAHAAACAAQSA
jgi:hypothetical protein